MMKDPTAKMIMTDTATKSEVAETNEKARRINQQVQIKDSGPCKKHIQVSIARADLDTRLAEKFAEVSVEAPIRGFRPGKAPKQLVERKYYKEVSDQLKTELLLASLEQLAEDHDLNPISPPDLNPNAVVFPKDGDLVYEFHVEVRPQVEAPEYKGLKLNRPVHTFAKEEIATEAERILRRMGSPVKKATGATVVRGDQVTLSGKVADGERSIGEIKSGKFRVEEKLAFKDGIAHHFAKEVVGAKVGDVRKVTIELSQSLSLPDLRGKSVTAELKIEDIEEIKAPELTPEFLSGFGVSKPEQFHELVEVMLKRRLEHRQRQSARQQFLSTALQKVDWDLPQDLLMKQARTAMARRVMEMRSDGIPEDEIRARQRLLSQDITRSTAEALKEHFVLQKVAELEKIEISDGEIEDEIRRLANQEGESPRRVRARMEREDLVDALAAELLERKVLDFIIQNAEFTDVPLAKEEEAALGTSDAQAVEGSETDPAAESDLAASGGSNA